MSESNFLQAGAFRPIQHLWNLRLDRRLFEFEKQFQLFRAEHFENEEFKFEIELLEVARLRALGKIISAQELAFRLQKEIDDGRVDLQIGLNHLSQGEDFKAWIYFTSAHEKSRDPMTQILALGNKVLCLNHFGLDYKLALSQLDELTENYAKDGGAGVASIRSQNLSQRMRLYFREGRFEKLRELRLQNAEITGQAQYLWCWSLSLPFNHQSPRALEEIQKMMSTDPSLHLLQGRLQTLLKIYSESDELSFHDRVDRLYLWLWCHLINSRQIPLIWIESEIRKLFSDTTSVASAEDLVMLRNCGAWLQLIRGQRPSDITTQLKNPSRVGEDQYPLFEAEWAFIHNLFKHLYEDQKEFLNFVPPKAQLIFWKTLNNSDLKVHLDQQHLIKVAARSKHWHLFSGSHVFIRQGDMIVDQALSMLVSAFRHRKSLDFKYIAEVCFGAPQFDEKIHVDMIQRLVIKFRKLIADSKKLTVRGNQIFLLSEFSCVLIESSALSASAKSAVIAHFVGVAQSLPANKVPKNKIPSFLLGLDQKESLNRLQIEKLTGWSKATTNRKLSEYVEKKWLLKKGRGTQITYSLSQDFK